MTDSFIGKLAVGLALIVSVLGTILPLYTPAHNAISLPFGLILATFILLWAYSD